SYLRQTQSYLNDLIYSTGYFDPWKSLAALAALCAVAWLSRDPRLKFCWLFFTIGVIPIGFISPRGLYAVYIPIAGLAIFLSIWLVRAAGRFHHAARAGLFVIAAIGLAALHYRNGSPNVTAITAEEHHIRDVILQLRQVRPEPAKGSRILLLKDPFEGRVWDSTFLLRLAYRDNDLVVDRAGRETDPDKYDYVWSFEESKLRWDTSEMKKGGRMRSAN